MSNLRNYALILSLAGNVVFAYLLADGALLKAWKRTKQDILLEMAAEETLESVAGDLVVKNAKARMDGIKIAEKPCDHIEELATGRSCK